MPHVIAVHAFSDNYIWLVGAAGSRQVAIVDPGEAEPVVAALQQRQLAPAAILVTHHHGDHVGGIRQLLGRYDIPVYGPAHEAIPGMSHPLVEGDRVVLESIPLELAVLDVPGHTRGHIAYYGQHMLFCGDTLFSVGCGRLFEGTAKQMHASLEKIRALPDDTQIYCAHEYTLDNIRFARVVEPDNPDLLQREMDARKLRADNIPTVPSSLGQEKRINPFLRSHIPAVIAAAEAFQGQPLGEPAVVFGTVRHWKDTLD